MALDAPNTPPEASKRRVHPFRLCSSPTLQEGPRRLQDRHVIVGVGVGVDADVVVVVAVAAAAVIVVAVAVAAAAAVVVVVVVVL
eukprot:5210991-Pyramimonas_sp.AAC.1